jgi:hypothetical protein
MAASAVNLPPGFELEDDSSNNLPTGFELVDDKAPQPISPVQSAVAGAAQGASLGFADEGVAGIHTIPKVMQQMFGGKVDPQALLNYYRKIRDQYRGHFAQAEEENPKSYLAGEFAGGAALTPVMPEATIPKMAAMGAVQGLGSSDADLTKGDIGGATRDVAIGAGTGAFMGGAAKSAQKTLDAMSWGTKKAITSLLGPTEEAINARLKYPNIIRNAPSYAELAEGMPSTLDTISHSISDADGKAWGLLSNSLDPEKAYSKDQIIRTIENIKSELPVEGQMVGLSDKKAAKTLNDLILDVMGVGNEDYISESNLKRLITTLDSNIDWQNPDAGTTNHVLEALRTSLDKNLKHNNPEYESAMKPVAERTRLLNDAKRLFNLKSVPGEGLVPTDTTASKLQGVTSEKKAVSQEILDKIKQMTGADYVKASEDYALAKQFEGGKANGSRSVNQMMGIMSPIGGGVGAMVGGPAGAAVGAGAGAAAGAMAGSYIDKKGGQMAGDLIDWYLRNKPENLGKYASVLGNAARNGTQAVATSHFVLMNRDHEYRQMIEGLQKQENE